MLKQLLMVLVIWAICGVMAAMIWIINTEKGRKGPPGKWEFRTINFIGGPVFWVWGLFFLIADRYQSYQRRLAVTRSIRKERSHVVH